MGLLLLRATVGVTVAIQGGSCLADAAGRTSRWWAAGLLEVAIGALLLIGLLTPIVSLLVGLGSVAIALSWFPGITPILSESWLSTVFVVIMAVAIGFLGPGAFSLDSRLFGRREVIIPPAVRSPKS